ncbi:Uncharacterized protein FVE85_5269 [Porphyridium purpureum]|uniref:Methyltransferase type 12 domain-containing protein n=1 Tax=Porphyridium purpureum TaxID=35688 RepID=A0A5J4Z434_PORPP|nr:Uncharacterized protein FVE85_5269 [Porphyridium purpureum]|eukprot:POR4939..scf295_1
MAFVVPVGAHRGLPALRHGARVGTGALSGTCGAVKSPGRTATACGSLRMSLNKPEGLAAPMSDSKAPGSFDAITSDVEKLYNTYPFPPDPLIDEAPIGYNWRWHYPSAYGFCTGRMPPADASIEILDAGCGTGCGTEYLVHLNPNARVTALDLSAEALKVAKERIARSCGQQALDRVEFEHRSLFELENMDGAYDHINCVGVIHHTPDPQRALNALASKLKPGGILHIFVYALYGRWEIRLMQRALRILQRGKLDFKEGVRLGRKVFAALPENNRLRQREQTRWAQENQRDSTFSDMYLHPQEYDYTVPSVFEMIDASGLEFVGFSNPRNFDLKRLLGNDEELIALAESLPLREKLELVELLDPESVTHFEFFLAKPPLRKSDWSSEDTLRAAKGFVSPCIHGFPGNFIFDRDYFPVQLKEAQKEFMKAIDTPEGGSVAAAMDASKITQSELMELVEQSIVMLQE